MARPYNTDTLNLNHAQSTIIANGHGLFKRQYVVLNLMEHVVARTPQLAWEATKRDMRVQKSRGMISRDDGNVILENGRELLESAVQVLATELDKYDLLDERLGMLARRKKESPE